MEQLQAEYTALAARVGDLHLAITGRRHELQQMEAQMVELHKAHQELLRRKEELAAATPKAAD